MRLSRQTVRVALRSFTRHRGFTIVAVVSLALAIALNTTMYGVLDAMISPAPAWREPGDVDRISLWGVKRDFADQGSLAKMVRDGVPAFEAVTRVDGGRSQVAVEYHRAFAMASTAAVAPNLFAVLGVHPVGGRYFGEADELGDASSVMISERLARELFADGEPGVGQAVDVDGVPRKVIGIIAASATDLLLSNVDVWTLPGRDVSLSSQAANIVRLRHGVAGAQVDAELRLLANRVAARTGQSPRDVRYQLTPFVGKQFQLQSFDYALTAAVLAILLVACANLANLQLARGIGRSRELAVRAARLAAISWCNSSWKARCSPSPAWLRRSLQRCGARRCCGRTSRRGSPRIPSHCRSSAGGYSRSASPLARSACWSSGSCRRFVYHASIRMI
jgi:putative ABC transport system permease protein